MILPIPCKFLHEIRHFTFKYHRKKEKHCTFTHSFSIFRFILTRYYPLREYCLAPPEHLWLMKFCDLQLYNVWTTKFVHPIRPNSSFCTNTGQDAPWGLYGHGQKWALCPSWPINAPRPDSFLTHKGQQCILVSPYP